MNRQLSLLQVISTKECEDARSKLKVGDKVIHVKSNGIDWSHPKLNHLITKGGIITNMSPYRPEIEVKWLETGNIDCLNPLDVIKQ